MRFLKGDKLFSGKEFVPGDKVLVLDEQNLLKDIISENEIDPLQIERHRGIITPGFVNAHCHLELSHMKGVIPQRTGLSRFATQVIRLRNLTAPGEKAEKMKDADDQMFQCGIVAVGDISNTSESFPTKTQSSIFYHTFVEVLGLNPAVAESNFRKGADLLHELRTYHLQGSLAAHAPYSTSLSLMMLIAEKANLEDQPTSLHNQESQAENDFFAGNPSDIYELYASLGLDISWFKPPGSAGTKNYLPAIQAAKTILVHNTFSSSDDIRLAENKNTWWCLCPAANLYIEDRLPDYRNFPPARICIGTDSLASNAQLDLVSEANLILARSEVFSITDILSAMTINAAKALNIDDRFGSFILGQRPGLNLITFADNQIKFITKLA